MTTNPMDQAPVNPDFTLPHVEGETFAEFSARYLAAKADAGFEDPLYPPSVLDTLPVTLMLVRDDDEHRLDTERRLVTAEELWEALLFKLSDLGVIAVGGERFIVTATGGVGDGPNGDYAAACDDLL